MATIVTYEDVTPSFIENTIMRKKLLNGVHKVYTIQAVDGYVLHDTSLDWEVRDPYTDQLISENLGYTEAEVSVSASYDFATTEVIAVNGQTVTAYGSREIYAIPSSEVPSEQIFGGGDNDHNREHEERLAKEAEEKAMLEAMENEAEQNESEM